MNFKAGFQASLPFCKFAQCMLSQDATGKEEVGKERETKRKKENELTLSLWGGKEWKRTDTFRKCRAISANKEHFIITFGNVLGFVRGWHSSHLYCFGNWSQTFIP